MIDSLVSSVGDKLKTVLRDEVDLLVGVTSEIQKLSRTFTFLQAVLADAEHRRVKDKAVLIWFENLKDVAYDVDDILDEWRTEALRQQAPDEGNGSSCFSFPVTCFLFPGTSFNNVKLRHEIGSRIKEVGDRLDDIEKEKNLLGLRVDSGERERVDSEVRRGEIRERETNSLLDQPFIVGREDEKKRVVDLLLGGNSREVNEVPFVISIVGMGGLGKTTLAQLIYNDENVMGHFDMRMWVCVSEDFDVKRITKSIIESTTGNSCESLDLAELQDRLREMLHAKRFLLVLDDVWSDDREKWDKLRFPFQSGALGSRIVITTRSENVALAMGSVHMHKLAVLSDNDCWLLFSHIALEHRGAEECSELEEIGRVIVKKCGGVPLAAETIGSAMCSRKTRSDWELVLRSDVWKSDDVLGGILQTLLLSYHDLPPALMRCFAYFSIFPKDWQIEKDMIVRLWVAQGFIRSGGSRDMEEIGGLYFDDLLRRSLLLDAELDDDKNILKCKMHDLVHDLAQFVAGRDCSPVEIGNQDFFIRHSFLIVSHEAGEVDPIWATLYKAHKLRTLLRDSRISTVPQNLFDHFRFLRALDLSRTDMKKLPQTVGKLKLLRYLDLSYTDIEALPERLSNCINLQTLRLNHCKKLRKLPRGMQKMTSLINLELEGYKGHLTIDSVNHVRLSPQDSGWLTGLETLTVFIVGHGDEGCKCGQLKHFNWLQRLQIIGLENVTNSYEAREAELFKKHKLHALSLQYDYSHGEPLDDEVEKIEDVLESLQPYRNLKELYIWCYQGSKLPKWTEDSLFSHLLKVELHDCRKCKQLPGLGKLPSLKLLKIVGMTEVTKVGGEFDNSGGSGGGFSFPKLQILIFSNMPNWEEWELSGRDGEVMPSLLELEINDCGKLKALPLNLLPLIQKLTLDISNDGMSSGGPFPLLHKLKHLVIRRSPDLTSLPCDWLGKLKALQTLEIHRCPRLRSLSRPEELQHLTMLQELKISFCPLLEKRCQDGGKYQDKIPRVRNISIGHPSYTALG